MEGVLLLRKESWKLRKALRSEVGDTRYWRIDKGIRERSKKIRSKKCNHLRRKEENLRRKNVNCEKH